jgi:YebC/PmpR family DNA-binding regulatory protein
MSGHSKWATIKRKKGATDSARGKIFTKLARELVTAARIGGGDASGNSRLRKAIADAKAQQMPNENIKRAIQRGTGEIEGAAFEEVLYEGTGPSGTLFLVEGMTDNRNRTAAELRKIFEKHNGQMGGSGTAGWAFDRLGLVALDKTTVTEEQLMETAVGAGADDYRDEGDVWTVYMPPTDLDRVSTALEDAKLPVQSSKVAFIPKNKKAVAGRDAEVCLNLVDALDDHEDVQNVYADFDISDEELLRITGIENPKSIRPPDSTGSKG